MHILIVLLLPATLKLLFECEKYRSQYNNLNTELFNTLINTVLSAFLALRAYSTLNILFFSICFLILAIFYVSYYVMERLYLPITILNA